MKSKLILTSFCLFCALTSFAQTLQLTSSEIQTNRDEVIPMINGRLFIDSGPTPGTAIFRQQRMPDPHPSERWLVFTAVTLEHYGRVDSRGVTNPIPGYVIGPVVSTNIVHQIRNDREDNWEKTRDTPPLPDLTPSITTVKQVEKVP